MHTAGDDVPGVSLRPRRLKHTLLTPDSANQFVQKSFQRTPLQITRIHYYSQPYLTRHPTSPSPTHHFILRPRYVLSDPPDELTAQVERRRLKSRTAHVFRDFNANTTLHGLKYLSERGLTVFERVFWLLTFLLSLILCFSLIYNVWYKWQNSPVIVSFSEKMIPVWQVPFPSVTICPQAKIRASAYNYTRNFKNWLENLFENWNTSSMEYEKLDNLAQVCNGPDDPVFLVRDKCNHTIANDINELSPAMNDIFYICWWRNSYTNCSKIFQKVLTSEGICYNFNGLSAKEMFQEDRIQTTYKYIYNEYCTNGWSIENGYTTKADEETYPERGRTSSNLPSCDNPTDPDTFLPSLSDPGGTVPPVPHYNFLSYPEIYPDDCGDSVI
ncbi:Pickpocket protein 28 [Eumeta japonica]|uniref:Pickpocket protein 28 n=1 Tax=Eumeta variegata TaxID=151549 RepID=A0A4C1VFL8_EUMVA|nr:Pickpocket protein 28 [Eumeta japonica]